MNRWCGCEEKAKSGKIEGIEFEACLSCENLSWEPTETKNFFAATIDLSIEFEDPSAANDTRGNFVAWLNEVLASFEQDWELSVDRRYLDEETLVEPIEDGAYETINLRMSKYRFDVVEDGEETGWFGIYESELQNLSDEELAKRAVINLWSHMVDYQLYEVAKLLIEHIENHRFRSISNPASQANRGSAVTVSYNGQELIWTLSEKWLEGMNL